MNSTADAYRISISEDFIRLTYSSLMVEPKTVQPYLYSTTTYKKR